MNLTEFNKERLARRLRAEKAVLSHAAAQKLQRVWRRFVVCNRLVDELAQSWPRLSLDARIRWLVWLGTWAPLATILREDANCGRRLRLSQLDPKDQLLKLLQNTSQRRERVARYPVFQKNVADWRQARQLPYELPPCWTTLVISTIRVLSQNIDLRIIYAHQLSYLRFLQLAQRSSCTEETSQLVKHILDVIRNDTVDLRCLSYVCAIPDLVSYYFGRRILTECDLWPSEILNPMAWVAIALLTRESQGRLARLCRIKGDKLFASWLDSGGVLDYEKLAPLLSSEDLSRFQLFMIERCASVITGGATGAAFRLMRHLLSHLTNGFGTIRDILRQPAFIEAIIRDASAPDRFSLFFVPTSLPNAFVIHDVSAEGAATPHTTSLDRVAEQFISYTEYTECAMGDLVTYIQPLDSSLLDAALMSPNLLSSTIRELGAVLWPDADSTPNLPSLVRALGPAPGFVSQLALTYRVFLLNIQQQLLILDDSRLVIRQHDGREDKDLWFGILTFPVTSDQFKLLFKIINHISYLMINTLSSVLVPRGLDLNPETTSEHIVNLTARVCRLAAQRVSRLYEEPAAILGIQDLARSMRYLGAGGASADHFSNIRFPYPGCHQAHMIARCLTQLQHAVGFEQRATLLRRILQVDRAARGDIGRDQKATLPMRRTAIIEDAMNATMALRASGRALLRIQFIDGYGLTERGVDGGGLSREWLLLLAQNLVADDGDLFCIHAASGSRVPNPLFDEYRRHALSSKTLPYAGSALLELCGYVAGKAILESLSISALELAPVFLNRVLRNTNSLDDLRAFDPALYKSVRQLQAHAGDISELALTFTVTLSHKELRCDRPLANPPDQPVTGENFVHYCVLLTNFWANRVFDDAAAAFRRGLQCCVPEQWYQLFNAAEFARLLAGSREIDLEDLKANTVYAPPYSGPSDPTVQTFWRVLDQFSQRELAQFCKFVFSFDRAPVLGFAALEPKFALSAAADAASLPQASTCVNLLKLPQISDEQELRRRLLLAFRDTAGFELA